MSRVARKKEEKRTRIREAARELLRTQGWQRTTIRAVAERADVATGTVLAYFDSKVGLLTSLFFTDLAEVIQQRFASVPAEAELVDQLLHLFEGLFRYYAAEPDSSQVFVRETLFMAEPYASAYDALSAGFVEQITHVVRRHASALRDEVEPSSVAQVAFSLYLVNVANFLRGVPLDPEGSLAELRRQLEAFLAPLWQR